MPEVQRPRYVEIIKIPGERTAGYRAWIDNVTQDVREKLPFSGPADMGITVGSGLGGIVDALQLSDTVHLSYERLGLPVGSNSNHVKEFVAGVNSAGKKIIVAKGRTHAYEIPVEGFNTYTWGHLSQMELASGYLAVLNEIGVNNMIITCAAGGINHPLSPDKLPPFEIDTLPVIGLISADLNVGAYQSPNMGFYKGDGNDFFGLRDSDQSLIEKFRDGMRVIGGGEVPGIYYFTSPSTPSFEDIGTIHYVAINNGQAVGMSYGYEKAWLSSASNIKKFAGVVVITNPQQLVFLDDSKNKGPISVAELRLHYPHEFKKAFVATDAEVQEKGALAVDKLGRCLSQMAIQL